MNIAFEATTKTVMFMRSVFIQTLVVVQMAMTLWLEGSKKTMLITLKTPLGVIVAQTTIFLPMISTCLSLKQLPPQPRFKGSIKKTTDLEN